MVTAKINLLKQIKMIEALNLLKTNRTTEERADAYVTTIKRNIQTKVIDKLIIAQEAIETKILDLKDLNLETNFNAGLKRLSAEDCEARFTQIIELELEYTLQAAILKTKQASFNNYFKDHE